MNREAKNESVAHEIAQEKAQALNRTASLLEGALTALRDHDARRGANEAGSATAAAVPGTAGQAHAAVASDRVRAELVARAADRVTHLVVLREAQGFRDPKYVFDFYGVPAEVIARLGIRRPST